MEIRFKQRLTLVLQFPLQKQNLLFVSEHVAILLVLVWIKLGSSVCLKYGRWGHWICSDFSDEQTASNFKVSEFCWGGHWSHLEVGICWINKKLITQCHIEIQKTVMWAELLQNPKKLTQKFTPLPYPVSDLSENKMSAWMSWGSGYHSWVILMKIYNVKSEWSYTCTPPSCPVCLNDLDRHDNTFISHLNSVTIHR